jgi:hypothetical protein
MNTIFEFNIININQRLEEKFVYEWSKGALKFTKDPSISKININ